MLLNVAHDDLMYAGVRPFGMSLGCQDAQLGIGSCPIAHAPEEAIADTVLLHPNKSNGLVGKAPCFKNLKCLLQARKCHPHKQRTVFCGKLTHWQSHDVFEPHCWIMAFCRTPLTFLGIGPIRPRRVGIDDVVFLHSADLLSAHGRWILRGCPS